MHLKRWLGVVCLVGVCAPQLAAQQRVDSQHLNERIILVTPMAGGAGTYADPKRPLLAPTSQELSAGGGILSYSAETSDDGLFAIVEIVARFRPALQRFLGDARAVKVFEKGKHRRSDIERELKLYKKAFSMARRTEVKLP